MDKTELENLVNTKVQSVADDITQSDYFFEKLDDYQNSLGEDSPVALARAYQSQTIKIMSNALIDILTSLKDDDHL